MAPISFHHLTNPLITSTQLLNYPNSTSSKQNLELTQSIDFAQCLLTQSAGVLLRLPQEVIATAIVLLQRHWIGSAQISNYDRNQDTATKHDAKTTSAATIYLAAKMSFTPLSPRSVVNVYAYLMSDSSSPLWFVNPDASGGELDGDDDTAASQSHVSEGTYERRRTELFAAETYVLATLGFDTHVSLPHGLALTYIQALLGGPSSTTGKVHTLALRTIEHLNGGLMSPQLVYLTHQPNALAVAAIYLASRERGIKLPEVNWWEVFDVEREELGFLVLALGSLEGFVEDLKDKWKGKAVPL